jgi:DNA-binding transcriptional LysR family regulator
MLHRPGGDRGIDRVPGVLLAIGHIPDDQDWASILGAQAETLEIQGNLTANNAEVLKECAIQGMGVVLLPAFVVDDAMADGRLRQVLPDCSPAPFGLYAVRPSSRLIPARVRLFIEYLGAALRD